MVAAGAAATAVAAHSERRSWAPGLTGRWPKPEGCLLRTSRPRSLKAADRRKVPQNTCSKLDLRPRWFWTPTNARSFASTMIATCHVKEWW